jgi:hypothetical protein
MNALGGGILKLSLIIYYLINFFREVRIMERHLSIKIKLVGNGASIPQIRVHRPTRGQHHG